MTESDEILEKRLREEASYIDDDGFTARVISRLPVRRRRNPFRAIVLTVASLLAAAFGYFLTEEGRFVWEAVAYLEMVPGWILLGTLLVVTIVMAAFALAGSVQQERRPQTLFR